VKKKVQQFINDKFGDVYNKIKMRYSGKDKILYIDDDRFQEIIESIAIEFGNTLPFGVNKSN
jgi:hypothetical protein